MNLESVIQFASEFRMLFRDKIVPHRLAFALSDLVKNLKSEQYAIGGDLAIGFHSPRGREEIELIYHSDRVLVDLHESDAFETHQLYALKHKNTGIVINLVTPEFGYPALQKNTFERVLETVTMEMIHEHKIRIVSAVALVALKLLRYSRQDQADIEGLLQYNNINEADLRAFNLSEKHIQNFHEITNNRGSGHKKVLNEQKLSATTI